MLTVAEMIAKTRQTIHDEKELEYSDVELTNYLNDGNRVLRRTAMSVYPEVLAASMEGYNVDVEISIDAEGNTTETETVTDKIIAEKPFTRILRVVIDGEQIKPIGRSEIDNYDDTGPIKFYYLTGFNTINLFPAPTGKVKYRIDYIEDMTLLDLGTDASPYPLVLDDLLVEYAVLRSSISDEFNMQKETTLIGTIIDQIEDVLRNMSPLPAQVSGYWDSGYTATKRW